jgi:hypothetical protein
MATDSTKAVYKVLRDHLLSFAPNGGGQTLTTRLGGRLYVVRPPDEADYPYGLLRLFGWGGLLRRTVNLEVVLYFRPVTQAQAAEDAMDVVDQAMLMLSSGTGNNPVYRTGTGGQRDTLPPAPDVVDKELVVVRSVYPLIVWPSMLTQYSI